MRILVLQAGILAVATVLVASSYASEPENDQERWTAAEREDVQRLLKATTINAVKTTTDARAAMKEQGKPVMLYQGTPVYPKEQARREVQGCVAVDFDIRPDGKTDDFEVVKSHPAGVFDDLAVRAIYATEFEPFDPSLGAKRHRQIFEFFIGQPLVREHSKLNPLTDAKRAKEQAELRKACGAEAAEKTP